MNRTLVIIIIVLFAIIIGVLVYVKFFKKKITNINCDSKFLFVGDSLTAFDQSYADQLTSGCPNINMKKIAEVGMKTDWMLQQLQNELATNKYDVITIWGGVNDIYALNSIDSAESNLQQMYDLAKNSGAKIVALTIPPTRTYSASDDNKVNLTNYLNNWILSNKSLDAVIDANALVNDGNEGTKSQYLQPDTLHLTSSGQSIVSNDYANKVINK